MADRQIDRQLSYDLLRSISCISVVILHIASMYVKGDFISLVPDSDYMTASFWRVITNLGVPSFVMLSGAFIIKVENIDYVSFYQKTVRKIVVPTIIFSIIYVLMHYAEILLAHILHISIGTDKTDLWSPVLNLLKGQPNVTMWYMYMIIPLYLITPVIVMIKKAVSVKAYRRLAVIMMFYSLLVSISCSLSWILQFATWIGYFLLGDVIREWGQEFRNNHKKYNWQLLGYGLIVMAYLLLIVYWYLFTYVTGQLVVPGSFSWVIIIATLIQFVGFSVLSIKNKNRCLDAVSKYSLEIYLIHPIFCEISMQLFGRIIKWFPAAWMIPVYSLLVIIACMGGAMFLHVRHH